ncbi:hypothetical protein StoSoilA2_36480 [Arthrobacter sp. StoSoilA2]|uniref:hypothetical protein n=1 Tax=Arthrobacter sp. StoSoilA2 TaxID=2830990 RepID=UPI001CC6B5D2|nr:hypothetical protein [Arthrobacter sp. StoSoilA2]BCW37592.1 hypothetical protein StoSoilA2_36480 [Arthrobacter sp. StoSoilA2]
MNQLSPGPHDSHPTGPDTAAGKANDAGTTTAAKSASGAPTKYEAVAGPFTIRDLTVFGSVLLMFIASLLPMFGGRFNLWNLDNLFFLLLGIILPVVVVALFVARRLQPGTIVRVGSLSIDQFASVTAAFAVALFFLTIAQSFNGSVLLGLVGSVGLLAATVLAPHLPLLSTDFKGRAETPAHIVARQAAIPTRKPAAPKPPKEPKAPKQASGLSTPGSQATGYQAQSAGSAGSHPYAPPAGASPYAPPATSGPAAPAPTGGPAVVHSADATPATQAQAAAPAAGSAPSAATPTAAAPAASGSAAQTSPAEPSPAEPDVVVENPVVGNPVVGNPGEPQSPTQAPATTQHAQQPAAQVPDAQQPAAQQPASQPPGNDRGWAATMATPIVSSNTRSVSDSIGATVDPSSRPDDSGSSPAYEAFWFAVAQPRTAYDERTGAPAFTIEPGGWVLALEDRGDEFLVQDTDGKVGVLRELSNIERG